MTASPALRHLSLRAKAAWCGAVAAHCRYPGDAALLRSWETACRDALPGRHRRR